MKAEKIDFLYEEAQARPGAFSQYDMMAVYPTLAKIPKDGLYLEIGVQHGRSMSFARKWSKGKVVGIDKDENHDFDALLKSYDNWRFIRGDANNVIFDEAIDVLFIDGDHSYEAVKKDWDKWSPLVKSGGMIFLHDCDNTSPGVVELFKKIKWDKGLSRDQLNDRNTSIAWIKKP